MRISSKDFFMKIKTTKMSTAGKQNTLMLKKILSIPQDKRTATDKSDIRFLRSSRTGVCKTLMTIEIVHKKTLKSKQVTFNRQEEPLTKIKKIKDTMKSILLSVSVDRKNRRALTKEKDVKFGEATVSRYGGVFKDPGTILYLLKNHKLDNPFKEKKPMSEKQRYVGIELEFNIGCSPQPNDEKSFIAGFLKAKKVARYLQVHDDPSCGHEIRMLVPEKKFKPILKETLEALNGLGFKADERCGIHIHLDMRDRDVKKCFNNLVKLQEIMYKLVPVNRRGNNYCKRNTTSSFDSEDREDRYFYVNAGAYDKHKTLEVRLHQNSLDYDELSNWIDLLLKAVNREAKIKKDVKKLSSMAKTLSLSKEHRKYIASRYKRFNGKEKKSV